MADTARFAAAVQAVREDLDRLDREALEASQHCKRLQETLEGSAREQAKLQRTLAAVRTELAHEQGRSTDLACSLSIRSAAIRSAQDTGKALKVDIFAAVSDALLQVEKLESESCSWAQACDAGALQTKLDRARAAESQLQRALQVLRQEARDLKRDHEGLKGAVEEAQEAREAATKQEQESSEASARLESEVTSALARVTWLNDQCALVPGAGESNAVTQGGISVEVLRSHVCDLESELSALEEDAAQVRCSIVLTQHEIAKCLNPTGPFNHTTKGGGLAAPFGITGLSRPFSTTTAPSQPPTFFGQPPTIPPRSTMGAAGFPAATHAAAGNAGNGAPAWQQRGVLQGPHGAPSVQGMQPMQPMQQQAYAATQGLGPSATGPRMGAQYKGQAAPEAMATGIAQNGQPQSAAHTGVSVQPNGMCSAAPGLGGMQRGGLYDAQPGAWPHDRLRAGEATMPALYVNSRAAATPPQAAAHFGAGPYGVPQTRMADATARAHCSGASVTQGTYAPHNHPAMHMGNGHVGNRHDHDNTDYVHDSMGLGLEQPGVFRQQSVGGGGAGADGGVFAPHLGGAYARPSGGRGGGHDGGRGRDSLGVIVTEPDSGAATTARDSLGVEVTTTHPHNPPPTHPTPVPLYTVTEAESPTHTCPNTHTHRHINDSTHATTPIRAAAWHSGGPRPSGMVGAHHRAIQGDGSDGGRCEMGVGRGNGGRGGGAVVMQTVVTRTVQRSPTTRVTAQVVYRAVQAQAQDPSRPPASVVMVHESVQQIKSLSTHPYPAPPQHTHSPHTEQHGNDTTTHTAPSSTYPYSKPPLLLLPAPETQPSDVGAGCVVQVAEPQPVRVETEPVLVGVESGAAARSAGARAADGPVAPQPPSVAVATASPPPAAPAAGSAPAPYRPPAAAVPSSFLPPAATASSLQRPLAAANGPAAVSVPHRPLAAVALTWGPPADTYDEDDSTTWHDDNTQSTQPDQPQSTGHRPTPHKASDTGAPPMPEHVAGVVGLQAMPRSRSMSPGAGAAASAPVPAQRLAVLPVAGKGLADGTVPQGMRQTTHHVPLLGGSGVFGSASGVPMPASNAVAVGVPANVGLPASAVRQATLVDPTRSGTPPDGRMPTGHSVGHADHTTAPRPSGTRGQGSFFQPRSGGGGTKAGASGAGDRPARAPATAALALAAITAGGASAAATAAAVTVQPHDAAVEEAGASRPAQRGGKRGRGGAAGTGARGAGKDGGAGAGCGPGGGGASKRSKKGGGGDGGHQSTAMDVMDIFGGRSAWSAL